MFTKRNALLMGLLFVLLFTAAFVIMNLLADLTYAVVDPRIRYS